MLLNLNQNSIENAIVYIVVFTHGLDLYCNGHLRTGCLSSWLLGNLWDSRSFASYVFGVVRELLAKETSSGKYIKNKKRIVMRLVQLILVSIISLVVPFFSNILSFNILYVSWVLFVSFIDSLGSFSATFAALVLPALLNIVYDKKHKRHESKASFIKHHILFVLFIMLMVICTYSSGQDLLKAALDLTNN